MLLPSLILSLSLTVGWSDSGPRLHAPQPVQKIARKRPKPPVRLPPNRARPGGGLNATQQSCRNLGPALTALVPAPNPVLTTTGRPTLLFYVGDTAIDVRRAHFSIFTHDDKTRVYATDVTLSPQPGIISIQLPANAVLPEGQPYHWYFKIYCQNSKRTVADLDVDGWIHRVALTPDRQQAIAAGHPDIWYDALASVAQQLQSKPQDPLLQARWRDLLQAIDQVHLATQPFNAMIAAEPRR